MRSIRAKAANSVRGDSSLRLNTRTPLRFAALLFALGIPPLAGCDFALRAFPARPRVRKEAVAFDPTQYAPLSVRAQSGRTPVYFFRNVAASRLESDLNALSREGARAVSLTDLHQHLVLGDALPPRSCALTFDAPGAGFLETAYPLLLRSKTPFGIFVDGVGQGNDALDASRLRKLDRDGLATVGVRLTLHPDRADDPQYEESLADRLLGDQDALERALGHPVPYLSFSGGAPSDVILDIVRRAGFAFALTEQPGPAEESPGILSVGRYAESRMAEARADCDRDAESAPAAVVDQPLRKSPVRLAVAEYAGVKLGLASGGAPITERTLGRKSVGEFVKIAGGAAGINGTFFADAKLASDDNCLIGPNRTSTDEEYHPEHVASLLPRLRNRPMVLFGPSRIALFPFQPGSMNDEAPLRRFMPDYTDAFVAGGWIVHDGQALTDAEMKTFAVENYAETRRRAFFGINRAGEAVLGASREVVSTPRLAQAAVAAGVKEAVLLDSGFSTSLIYGDQIIVTGHTAPHLPSRPVPHAIVLMGTLSGPPPVELASKVAPSSGKRRSRLRSS
jgi:peptidoglycan/xylan/chitin deacetylase (PgdA/CDA1 family)